jgi:hypothetical protein
MHFSLKIPNKCLQSYLANIFKRNENINGKDVENLCRKRAARSNSGKVKKKLKN